MFLQINWQTWIAIIGFASALFGLCYRLVTAFKDTVHDYCKLPVDKVSDEVHTLNERLMMIFDKERADHGKMMTMMQQIRTDHKSIRKHDRKIADHTQQLDRHDHLIKELNDDKLDK